MQPASKWSYQQPFPFDLLTANGVPETFTFVEPSANQAVADFMTTWDRRYDLAYYLLGTGVYSNGPRRHPTRIDLFAKRCVITGMRAIGFDGSWASYEFARLNVTFQPNPSGIGNENTTALITVTSENTGENMSLPGRDLKWSTGIKTGKPLSEQAVIPITKRTHHLSVHQWNNPPFAVFDTKLQGINSDTLNWMGRTITAGKMLFDSYSNSYDVYLFGIPTFKIDMTFMEKTRSWNQFPLVDGGVAWEFVTPAPFTPTALGPVFP